MTDIYYIEQGLFTTFIPNTKDGEMLWNSIAKENKGVAKIFTTHLKSTLKQIKDAGYSVRKKKSSLVEIDAEKLLEELLK